MPTKAKALRRAIARTTSIAVIVIIVIAAVGGVAYFYLTQPPSKSTVQFSLGGIDVAPNLCIGDFAESQGFFQQYIPGVTYDPSLPGATVATSLASGTIQMSFAETSVYVPSLAAGADYKVVAELLALNEWTIIVMANSTFQNIQDLHGQTIAVTGPGSSTDIVTRYAMAKAEGWQVNTDYHEDALGSVGASYAALEKGAVQAMTIGKWSALPRVADGTFRAVLNVSVPYPGLSVLATSSFISAHPDAVRATLTAFTAAAKLWNSNSTAALSFLETKYHEPPAVAQQVYNSVRFSTTGTINATAYQNVINFVYNAGGISQNMSASNWITNQFVPFA